jgi:hypothetical protein
LKKPRALSGYTRSAQRAGLLQTAAINTEEAARLYSVRCEADFFGGA